MSVRATYSPGAPVMPFHKPTADIQPLTEELEVLRDIHLSERELAEGHAVPHAKVAEELRELVRARVVE